jgi:hypothetical protein
MARNKIYSSKYVNLILDEVIRGLKERRDGALRLAHSKDGEERAGWLEHWEAFCHAIDMIMIGAISSPVQGESQPDEWEYLEETYVASGEEISHKPIRFSTCTKKR